MNDHIVQAWKKFNDYKRSRIETKIFKHWRELFINILRVWHKLFRTFIHTVNEIRQLWLFKIRDDEIWHGYVSRRDDGIIFLLFSIFYLELIFWDSSYSCTKESWRLCPCKCLNFLRTSLGKLRNVQRPTKYGATLLRLSLFCLDLNIVEMKDEPVFVRSV